MHYSHAMITQNQYLPGYCSPSVYAGCYKVQYLQNGRTFGTCQCSKDQVILPAELDGSLGLMLDDRAFLSNIVAMFGLEICSAAEVRLRRSGSIPCFDYICFMVLDLHVFGMLATLL